MSENCSSLSLDDVRVIVEQCVGSRDFELLDTQESSVNKESGGFMSDYLRFEMRVRVQDGTDKSYKLFAKTVPRDLGEHRDFVLETRCYVKEVGFYHKIIFLLQKHRKEAARTNDKGVIGIWTPYCYLTKDDIIVMEDLSALGFKMPNNRDLFDWNQCAIVLKKMASFHAASIIFEEKEKKLTETSCRIGDLHPELFTSVLDKSMPEEDDKGWFKAGIRAVVALVPYLPKYQHSTKLQRLIQEKIPAAFYSVEELATSTQYRNVVCHGDLWASNMLFRNGEDNRPESVRFVDYQLLRYAPPATDFVVFIHTTTNRKFRDRHNMDMLKVYYEEFVTELQNNGFSAEEIISFEELQKSFKFFSPAGRAIAGLYYQLILMDDDKKNSLFSSPANYSFFFLVDRSSDVRELFQIDEVYRYRLEEALNELIEKDVLNEGLEENVSKDA